VLEKLLLDRSRMPADWVERAVESVQRVSLADRPNVYALF